MPRPLIPIAREVYLDTTEGFMSAIEFIHGPWTDRYWDLPQLFIPILRGGQGIEHWSSYTYPPRSETPVQWHKPKDRKPGVIERLGLHSLSLVELSGY